jgi:hypothetical protein
MLGSKTLLNEDMESYIFVYLPVPFLTAKQRIPMSATTTFHIHCTPSEKS